jgi:hypothetical protein
MHGLATGVKFDQSLVFTYLCTNRVFYGSRSSLPVVFRPFKSR